MPEVKAPRRTATRGAAVTRIATLLLVICLVECATGSCLSYGHSCWGAHGKRSGKPPVTATDWYLNKLLHRMANAEMTRDATADTDDLNAIFRGDEDVNNRILVVNEDRFQDRSNRAPEAKPMLDDELLSKMKIWQIMRESSQDK